MNAPDAFTCAECGGVFEKGWSDGDAEAEAEALFGVADAGDDPGMAVVCDECFKRIVEAQ